ncbi:unnamed protein product [Rotaria sp. Silwood2]|nr:unnamed protein product [Rotaria sp. Silwood2]
MTTNTYYRIVGDIRVKSRASTTGKSKGKTVDITYGMNKTNFDDIAIIQRNQPLTSDAPYFVVEIHKCDSNAIISVGIASLDIDQHAG